MKDKHPFWKTKKLTEMTLEEWESLCDGCAICCLYKLEDEHNGQVELTNVVCRFLDLLKCKCTLYEQRNQAMPSCIRLTPSKVEHLNWLPDTCAYRLMLRGKPLPDWHPLVSGDAQSVHRVGLSVQGRVISETEVNLKHLEEYLIEDLYVIPRLLED